MEFRSHEARKAFQLFDKYFNSSNYIYYNDDEIYSSPSSKEILTKLGDEQFSGELCTDLTNYFGFYNYKNLELNEMSGIELLEEIEENRKSQKLIDLHSLYLTELFEREY